MEKYELNFPMFSAYYYNLVSQLLTRIPNKIIPTTVNSKMKKRSTSADMMGIHSDEENFHNNNNNVTIAATEGAKVEKAENEDSDEMYYDEDNSEEEAEEQQPPSNRNFEPTCFEQEKPLDLSKKCKPVGFLVGANEVAVPIVKGDVASSTTKQSVASRYNLNVSPVIERMPPGSDLAFVCPVCNQMFSAQHRLVKHMASLHKNTSSKSAAKTAKLFSCTWCTESFSRSDMLTRHMRKHTGQKPYKCNFCDQTFTRSDHLSTHERTHTGEKPYKCPMCNYAACRRDMITRHLKTHGI